MNGKFWFRLFLTGLMLSTLVLTGCDDGNDGVAGVDGASAYEVAGGDDVWGSEQEWLDSLAAHAVAADESCNVCHGENKALGLGINTLHPLVDPKIEIANIVVASVAGTGDTVTFDVFEDDGVTPVTGLTIADFRFYIADIVPAGTATANVPVTTWATAQPERWLYERAPSSSTVYPVGTLLEAPAGGTYTYTFAADLLIGDLARAPQFNSTHTQRLLIRAGDIEDLPGTADLSREAAIVDFVIPGDGLNTGVLSQDENTFSRAIVVQAACTNCHGDPLQSAAHGSGYQTPQGCVICHTPIGADYGDLMQADEAWLAALIHGIHSARGDFPPFVADPTDDDWDFSDVTYPQEIAECEKCHFDAGQAQADNWKTNPTAEACGTCHDVDFATGIGHGDDNVGGPQINANCTLCHPADLGGFGGSVAESHAVDYDRDNLLYNVTIALSPEKAFYEVGDTILVTATTDVAGFDYTNADTNFLRGANLYVYGPRALAVPVLTPGSTTDPAYMDPEVTPAGTPPEQGVSLLASAKADDANVQTDASGFKYQLLEVTEDMAAGTYMVQTNIDFSATGDRKTDGRHIGPRFYPLDGWELLTFQVGTAVEEAKVAGECTSCHEQRNFSTYAHRSYFGTDGCLACHDQSGNHADPLTNRVHAVHAASTAGDLTNVPGEDPDRVWDEITFPRDLNASCAACHNSGNESHRKNPEGSWGFACIGCHADTEGARDHMLQNGSPFPVH